MPNHTQNNITILCSNKSLLQQMEKGFRNHDLMKTFHPMPSELEHSVSGSENAKPEWQKEQSKDLIKKYGHDNWYNWCCDNWGTKWDVYNSDEPQTSYDSRITQRHEFSNDTNKKEKIHQLQISFHTAWSPPINFFHHLTEKHHEITQINLNFLDEGWLFIGTAEWIRHSQEEDVEYSEYIHDDMTKFIERFENKAPDEVYYNSYADEMLFKEFKEDIEAYKECIEDQE